MEIRKLEMRDVAAFREVRLQALREFPTAFGSSWQEEEKVSLEELEKVWSTRDPHNNFVVGAFENGELVGTAGFVQQLRHIKTAHKGMIYAMYVKPQAQSAGIGRKLIDHLIEQARKIEELEQIQLAVVCGNDRAKRLYEKVGFEMIGTEKHALLVDGVFYDEDLMVLFL